MASVKKNKTTSGSGVGFTVLIGAVVLIYFLTRLLGFTGDDSNRYIIAESGRIEDTVTLSCVITRDEQLFRAVSDGVVEYYYPGGRLLSKNTVIASIQDADYYGSILKDREEAIQARIQELSEDDNAYSEEFDSLKRSVETQVKQYLRTRDPGRYVTSYDLKEKLVGAVHQRQDLYSLLSSATARTLLEEMDLYQSVEGETSEDLWISEAGIISYSYDGFEGWDSSMIEPSFAKEYDSQYSFLNINMQEVSKGDPLYRLITSQSWYLTTFISNKIIEAEEMEPNNNLALFDGDTRLTGIIESIEPSTSDTSKVVIRMQARLADYMDQRLVNFTLSQNSYEGLKVSNKCLTEELFYKIPITCVYRSGKDYGVMVRNAEGDTFVPIDFSWNTDTEYYFSQLPEGITEGSTLLIAGSEETHALQEPVSVFGVYVINGVTEKFYHVDVLYQNNDYSIISGISLYDHVKVLN